MFGMAYAHVSIQSGSAPVVRSCSSRSASCSTRRPFQAQKAPPSGWLVRSVHDGMHQTSKQAAPSTHFALMLDRRAILLAAGASLLSVVGATGAQAGGDITTVFVAGASGATGQRTVTELAKRGLTVRAGVRNVEKARSAAWSQNPRVELVETDLTNDTQSLVASIGNAQAVISTVGSSGFNPKAYEEVDKKGVIKLVDAAKQAGVKKFVLQTSILTNGAAKGERFNPIYLLLNVTGALSKKLESEKYLRQSGLDFTIVRPGGLKNDPPSEVGNLIMRNEDTLFAKKSDPATAISRDTVAAVLVEALFQPSAAGRVVEIVASPDASPTQPEAWFS